ncbi:MAG: NADH-quinone oxidoreductase subunit NuoF [Chloroflexi bacterium]|nr:NADH-quinone oxidoreductase subunit NuoF [Chloroflexota bacterium]
MEAKLNGEYTILVCQGTGCVSSKSDRITQALENHIKQSGLSKNVHVKLTGCHGFCQQGPIVIVEPEGIFYTQVKEEDVAEIVQSHIVDRKYVERLFYHNPVTDEVIPLYKDIPFYSRQHRLILRNCGHINPEQIDDYLATGGYAALKKAISEMEHTQIIEEINRSGLRGRGGAGFPTGKKWDEAHKAKEQPKYVVCNADEGDPGAFMDRSVLEADPHSVIEGMAIAGYAIGTSEGYIYVRAEYPLAVKRLRIAIAQAKERKLLGKNIMGSGFNFDIEIMQGAGAFVCGEGSALMYSIEGKRGMPRVRPPRSVAAGLWGKPTSLNNVKTYASVPLIINRGADWYRSIGTEGSKGTAVFALTGKIANSGLIEVPMGATLREVVFDIGGGVQEGKKFKAVQTGGPSGGCLPESALDLTIDFESLTKAGSMMGSGGMVVMDTDTCMVDLARFFLNFCCNESCGKCVPCREGLPLMIDIMHKITRGEGDLHDIDHLLDLGETVTKSALCGLGTTAPNPVLSSIRYFRDEWEAHVIDKKCPALVCKALINFYVLPDKCAGCGICLRACPVEAISGGKRLVHVIDQEKCIKCATCLEKCPERFSAIAKVTGEQIAVPKEPVPIGTP